MAAHESPRTTKLYDRTGDEITLDEAERYDLTGSIEILELFLPHGLAMASMFPRTGLVPRRRRVMYFLESFLNLQALVQAALVTSILSLFAR
jgi:hypothetical protein